MIEFEKLLVYGLRVDGRMSNLIKLGPEKSLVGFKTLLPMVIFSLGY